MPAYLVTGASGFVGTRLVRALRKRGDTVATFSAEDGDIATAELPDAAVDHVFHLAARTFVPDSWSDPRGFYSVNVLGTVNALEYCRRRGCSATVMSSYVYGVPRSLPISEDHPLQAPNPYAHTKILAEETARFYNESFGVRATIVRPFNIYGPGQVGKFLIPLLINQALSPAAPTISVADERPRRDFVYIDDLVALLLATTAPQPKVRAYNAGSGSSVSVAELAAVIARLAGTDKPVESRGERRPAEILETVADISRARAELGWTPSVSLAEGLAATIRATESAIDPRAR